VAIPNMDELLDLTANNGDIDEEHCNHIWEGLLRKETFTAKLLKVDLPLVERALVSVRIQASQD